MTTTFLGFFMNRSNREEFVAPAIAGDIASAKAELLRAYPESRFALLTVYSRAELEHVLQGIDRWPGLPNKVQAPVTTDYSKITASTGGLPPLPGQVQAIVQPAEDIQASALPGWMQSFATQQAAAAKPQPAKPVKVPAFLNQPAAKAAPAIHPAPQPMMQAMAKSQAATQQPFQQQPQSLIERLKMAKGETMREPVRALAPSMPAAAMQAPAKAGSVIDILKGMRK